MCFGYTSNGPRRAATPEWVEWERRLSDIPPGHCRAIADAMKKLGEDILAADFHRGMGLIDAAGLLYRGMPKENR